MMQLSLSAVRRNAMLYHKGDKITGVYQINTPVR